jgi:ribosomal protein S18 acetylase RimI-like enzyme
MTSAGTKIKRKTKIGLKKMEVIKVCQYAEKNQDIEKIRRQMSEIFVEGFYHWLKLFCKDKEKLKSAFAHIFNPEVFYIAVENGEVWGIVACRDRNNPSVRLEKKTFRKYLGFIRGTITYRILKSQVEKPYPFEFTESMGAIEFVAISPKHRHEGLATEILNHVIFSAPYTEYVLEAADTNPNAVSLYTKLGFKEFTRVKEPHSKQTGVNFFIYMSRQSPFGDNS